MPPQSHIADRIYYDEQQCLEFTAQVTEIRELARVEGRPVFQVALDRTAFYPTSGGQPHDTGTLVATARSGAVLEAPVTDVTEDETGEVWHTTVKPLQPGTIVAAHIDAERRLDHMQQHSGQHLISALAAAEFGANTVGFHLGEKASTVDLTIAALDPGQIAHLEKRANEVVATALPITQQLLSNEEAQQLLASGVLRKLPGRAGDLRLITIQNTDRNACGGTHVATTAQIGPILLRRTERVRGNTRLTFLCGGRALASARQDWTTLSAAALQLSISPDGLTDQLARMQAELRELRKQLRSTGKTAAAD